MTKLRKLAAGAAVAVAVLGTSSPAWAHDCFNPQKNAHAPTAGVNYTIVGFDPVAGEPIFEQTGPGKGSGGFAALSPEVTGAPDTLYVHTLGNTHSGHEEVGGPGSQTAGHACDGKGIDYLDACFG
jgi:hypothetical protein